MDLYQSTAWTLVAALVTVLPGIRINHRFALLEHSNVPPGKLRAAGGRNTGAVGVSK